MKRFTWTLQKLLDVTVQRKRALRARAAALAREAAHQRGQIVRRELEMRAMLDRLSREEFTERMARQALVLRCQPAMRRELDRLGKALAAIESRRADTMRELLAVRRRLRTLEDLRERAYRRHLRQEEAIEQKQLDDSAQVAFARRLAKRPDAKAEPTGV